MGLSGGKFNMRSLLPRSARKAQNRLGVIAGKFSQLGGDPLAVFASDRWRRAQLEMFDAYYEKRQYDHLPHWDVASSNKQDDYVPVRERRPRINYNFAKVLTSRVASRLVGEDTFPTFTIPEDPDTEAFFRVVDKAANLKAFLMEPTRRCLNAGSGFVRFFFFEGKLVLEHYLSKFCYPVLNRAGELQSVTIKYVFDDDEDRDENGVPRAKWYKLELGMMADILYDNPLYDPEAGEPVFEEVARAEHNLGFVQGEWFRISEDVNSIDGTSLITDLTDFIDEMNYNLSQSSQAIGYNQDPQLIINGMDSEELAELVKSSTRGWNLGRDGKAQFIEGTMNGVKSAGEFRDKISLHMHNLARIVFHDPEKMNAQALSGKAMEIMNGPLVELVQELRPVFEKPLVALKSKMALAMLILRDRGEPIPVNMPDNFYPKTMSLTTTWPPVFPRTIVDLKEKSAVANLVGTGNLISRETLTRWLAKDFDVEDVEAEIAKIAAQPVINPFSGF